MGNHLFEIIRRGMNMWKKGCTKLYCNKGSFERISLVVFLCLSSCVELYAYAVKEQVQVPMRNSKAVSAMFHHPVSDKTKPVVVKPTDMSSQSQHVSGYSVINYRTSGAAYRTNTVAIGQPLSATSANISVSVGAATAMPSPLSIRSTGTAGRSVAYSTEMGGRSKRKVYHSTDQTDGNGNYYDTEEEEWLPIPGGGTGEYPGGLAAGSFFGETQQGNDGKWYWWNGSTWVDNTVAEPPTPIGDIPFIFCMLIGMGWMLIRKKRQRRAMADSGL